MGARLQKKKKISLFILFNDDDDISVIHADKRDSQNSLARSVLFVYFLIILFLLYLFLVCCYSPLYDL